MFPILSCDPVALERRFVNNELYTMLVTPKAKISPEIRLRMSVVLTFCQLLFAARD